MNPVVSRITIYPVKSLDGYAVNTAEVGHHSFLVNDRRFAMFGNDGKLINGKSSPLVHLLRLTRTGELHFECYSLLLNESFGFLAGVNDHAFSLFLSRHFDRPVELREDTSGNFQDVPHDAAITLVSTASLLKIGEWMMIDDLDELRARFRATIEISGVPAFWEDRLFAQPGKQVGFRIGEVGLECVGPRERCVVPTRHPETGDVYHGFAKTMAAFRWKNIPDHSLLQTWEHGYFLSVDCRITPDSYGKKINVGDRLIV